MTPQERKELADLAWALMAATHPVSEEHYLAVKMYEKYADESVRGDRPIKIVTKLIDQ